MQYASGPRENENGILKKSFDFADWCKYRGSSRVYSCADFIHKMKVALKEDEETKYWFFPFNEELIAALKEVL